MSLQWTAVATFLYAEVFLVLLLCVPFISPKRWSRIFKSRLVALITTYGNTAFIVIICILVFLLVDAFREVRKYSVTEKVDLSNNPVAIEHIHMKLFRAQRNEYIAGFALLLCLLLRRLATLLSQQATLMASNEAFKKQAEGANDAAKKYMEENEKLQEVRESCMKMPVYKRLETLRVRHVLKQHQGYVTSTCWRTSPPEDHGVSVLDLNIQQE
ncbi:B-cell receptor-associated protein 31-like [Garra rufa]|uniref:B-cell receptor-associated protein 31-like n=1 Tax=Garra rufa TaxID=137080 RepID=UPI003CCE926C